MQPRFCTIVHAVQETSTPVVGSAAPTAPPAPRGHTTHARVQPRHISGPGGGGAPGPGLRPALRLASSTSLCGTQSLSLKCRVPRAGASDRPHAAPARWREGPRGAGAGLTSLPRGDSQATRESASALGVQVLFLLFSFVHFLTTDCLSPSVS